MARKNRNKSATSNVERNFDSVIEYVDYCESLPANCGGGLPPSRDENRTNFFGTECFGDAVSLSRSGWSEGAQKVASLRGRFDAFLQAAKSAKILGQEYAVVGDYVDVGRYLTGEPECWGTEQDADGLGEKKVVSLRINTCVSGSVSTDEIIARGLTVLIAVDLLESCGIRCEVIVSSATKRGNIVQSNVTVKSAGQPLDIDSLAFSVAHPSFFRRFGFAFMEGHGHPPSDCIPCRMTDYLQREGTVEIDEVCTATGLGDELKGDVLRIANSCGLAYTEDAIDELLAVPSGDR